MGRSGEPKSPGRPKGRARTVISGRALKYRRDRTEAYSKNEHPWSVHCLCRFCLGGVVERVEVNLVIAKQKARGEEPGESGGSAWAREEVDWHGPAGVRFEFSEVPARAGNWEPDDVSDEPGDEEWREVDSPGT